jgi:hypothetical protein
MLDALGDPDRGHGIDEREHLRGVLVLVTRLDRLGRIDGHDLRPPVGLRLRIADDLPDLLDRSGDQSLSAIGAGHAPMVRLEQDLDP